MQDDVNSSPASKTNVLNNNNQCLRDVILSLTWEHINESTATNDVIRLRPETHLQTSYLSKTLSNSFT